MKKAQFRNLLHFVIGGGIGYLLSTTYLGIELFFQLLLTSIVLVVIGYFWEIGWYLYNKSVVDHKDVTRAVLGGLIINLITYII